VRAISAAAGSAWRNPVGTTTPNSFRSLTVETLALFLETVSLLSFESESLSSITGRGSVATSPFLLPRSAALQGATNSCFTRASIALFKEVKQKRKRERETERETEEI
jgi:hypothetical protein